MQSRTGAGGVRRALESESEGTFLHGAAATNFANGGWLDARLFLFIPPSHKLSYRDRPTTYDTGSQGRSL